jgi:hypothetical protein
MAKVPVRRIIRLFSLLSFCFDRFQTIENNEVHHMPSIPK